MYKTLIVCQAGLFAEALCETLKACPSFTLVGSFARFEEALKAVGSTKPAVAVVHLTQSSCEGAVAFVDDVRRVSPLTRIAFLFDGWEPGTPERLITGIENPRELSFLETGALSEPKELYSALASVASGLALWDRSLMPMRESWTPGGQELSEYDLEVLRLLAAGYSNLGIARKLGRSVESVKASISRVYETLGIDKANNPEKHPRVLAASLYRKRYAHLTWPTAPSREGRGRDRRFRSSI